MAASANIIKNVKSVVVPHTGGRRGIAAAAAAGIIAGDPRPSWKCCRASRSRIGGAGALLDTVPVQVERCRQAYLFDIQVRLFGGGHTAFAEIAGRHTNVIALQRDGQVLVERPYEEQPAAPGQTALC